MEEKSTITLITGGARSGKSRFGETLLSQRSLETLYIATAQVHDQEMIDRVEKHQRQRPSEWHTLEAYQGFRQLLPPWEGKVQGVLVDCMTLMVTQLMLGGLTISWEELTQKEVDQVEAHVMQEIDALMEALKRLQVNAVVITNEVGMGIVPVGKMSRDFRDIAGRANQQAAALADQVYFMVSGIPLQVK